MVEFALIFPLFVSLMLGTLTGGLAYNQKIQLTHATREAARYGSTINPGDTFTNGGTWANNVKALAISRAAGDLGVSGATVCVSLVKGTSPNVVVPTISGHATTDYTTNANGTPCDTTEVYPTTLNDLGFRVQVRASRPAKIECGFYSFTMTLTANASVKTTQDPT